MKYRIVLVVAVAMLCGLSALAQEWTLPSRAWTRVEPPAVWSFYAAPRGSAIADWKRLDGKDVNTLANRVIFYGEKGDVWSVPSVRVHNFQHPGEQKLELLTGGASDPAVVFDCMFDGGLTYEITVTDPFAPNAPGADGNAEFRVSRFRADSSEEKLDQFVYRGRSGLKRTGTLTVAPGERLAFRKTVTLADDFGRRACFASIRVRGVEKESRSGFHAAVVPAGRVLLDEYIPVPEREQNNAFVFNFSEKLQKNLPSATVRPASEPGAWEIFARAEKNDACAYGAGDLVLLYPVSATGNYRVAVDVSNVGLDAKGGDGGKLSVAVLPPDARSDAAAVLPLSIPSSRAGEAPVVSGEKVLKLNAGDRIALRIHANIDGYADLFRIRFAINPTEEAGEQPPAATPLAVTPQLDKPKRTPGVPMRKGLFWFAAGGTLIAGPNTEETLDLITKFVPDIAVIKVDSRPDLLPDPEHLRKRNIPSLIQTFGSGYEPYWRDEGAFEWDFMNRCHAEKSFISLSGTAHAAAIPHPAVKDTFDRLMRSSVRNGFTGYGFNDMVWHWGPGRGASGYNPETVKAFRESLKGNDEGFLFGWKGETPKQLYFRDYVKYYLGVEPRPEMVGLKSWDEYRPLFKPEYDSKAKAGIDATAEGMLLDLLVHYEWLKAADRIGKAAQEEGGFFQVLPNPEDLSNGNDFLFLAGLHRVHGRTEEYFQSPLFMNAAYSRFPYFRDRTADGTETGIVLEVGGGGNSAPYYYADSSLKIAYEITLATEPDHLEGDFWWNFPVGQTAKTQLHRDRYGAMLAYGLGFRYAREDASLKRLEPDFVSLTSRRLFRPWGAEYCPWNWWLDTEFSPELILFRLGYVFSGQGVESLQEKDFAADTVFFSASPVVEKDWVRFIELLNSGKIKNGIVMAGPLRTKIGQNLRPSPFMEFKPAGSVSGDLTDASGRVLAKGLNIGTLYEAPAGYRAELFVGGRPVVASRQTGAGTLRMLLFTPVPEKPRQAKVPDAAAGGAVFRVLLTGLGKASKWDSTDPIDARLYRNAEGVTLVSAMRRDRLAKQENGRYPADAPDNSSLRVRLEANRDYGFLTFPGLRAGEARTDADGMLTLTLGRAAQELFLVAPKEQMDALTQKFTARAGEFRNAMRLDGKSELPAE